MIGRAAILALIPHQGAMCLWDEVLAWDAGTIRLRAHSHRDPAHPLRAADGRLHAVHLCEYGAQALAVHGGLRAQAGGGVARPGLLVALRGVELQVACLDDLPDALEGTAEVLVDSEAGWQYAFRIQHAGTLLASGRAAVMPQRQP
ncbi:phosphotransferase [Cognatiluteimonas weifangensis]|uniref:Phosphotransferase n=1 Tax=Cognatiluteimonas weifangensis TaxID=2303539 RepID=A0A372DHE1_9GAMM|nr:phosphotransferase [Luteimonas weifangensis]RFP58943.1 phosphotransferase [Luteimonas weifangensis]